MEENNQRKPARKSTTRKKKDTEEDKKTIDSKVPVAKTPLVNSRKKPSSSFKTKTKDIQSAATTQKAK